MGRASLSPGFTLLEVVVAFAIAALALWVLVRTDVSGLALARSAARHDQAVSRARARLAMAVRATPLLAGNQNGDDGGGYTWHVHVAPLASTTTQPDPALTRRGNGAIRLALFEVTVTIAWNGPGGPREVRLSTEQIGEAPP